LLLEEEKEEEQEDVFLKESSGLKIKQDFQRLSYYWSKSARYTGGSLLLPS